MTEQDTQPVTVLVVDDSEINRTMLRSILEKNGYFVEECCSGQECLSYCKSNLPAVILLDIMMPGMSGLEVCQTLRRTFSKQELPIIMVTARIESSDVKNGFDVGANDYVSKPIDRETLLVRLDNQIILSQSYAALKQQRELVEYTLKIQQATGDALDQAILVHDSNGQVVYYNVVCAEYCNNKVPTNISEIGQFIFNGRLANDLELILRKITLDSGVIVNTVLEESGNGWLNVRLVSRPIAISKSREHYRIWAWRDKSEYAALERQTKEKVKLETVSTFALGIAHNFNNLFAAMLGASERLKKNLAADQRAGRLLEIISKSVNNGMALTKKMSSLAKRRSDNLEGSGTPLKLLLESVIEVGNHVQSNAVGIKFNLAESLNALSMQVEYLNLLDIVSHVVSNAIDAMPNGGELTVSARPAAQAGFVALEFTDTGCGMAPEVIDRVFEPFFSTKNLDQRNGMSMDGNGLGLWNVYNLVKLYGGDISIDSQLNCGTTVTITLPYTLGTLDAAEELQIF